VAVARRRPGPASAARPAPGVSGTGAAPARARWGGVRARLCGDFGSAGVDRGFGEWRRR